MTSPCPHKCFTRFKLPFCFLLTSSRGTSMVLMSPSFSTSCKFSPLVVCFPILQTVCFYCLTICHRLNVYDPRNVICWNWTPSATVLGGGAWRDAKPWRWGQWCSTRDPKKPLTPFTTRMRAHSVVSDSATPWAVAHHAPLPIDSPGKNTGVGCHALLQGIFPTQGSNLGLPHCRPVL